MDARRRGRAQLEAGRVEHVDGVRRKLGVGKIGDGPEAQTRPQRGGVGAHDVEIPDDEGAAALARLLVGQHFNDELGTDAGWVAHGDGD